MSQQQYNPPRYSQQTTVVNNGPPLFNQNPEYGHEPDKQQYFDEKPGLTNPNGQTFEEAFEVPKPRWNDWPFSIFFIAVVGGFIAVSVLSLRSYAQTYSAQGSGIYTSTSTFTLNTNTVVLFVFALVISIVISLATLLFARIHPKGFITTGIVVNVIMGIGTAIAYFVMHYYSAAVVFLILALISAWCYWTMRSRIPFSAEVFVTVIDVLKSYKSNFVVSCLGSLATFAFSFLFSVVLVATYMKYDPNENNPGCSVEGGNCTRGKLIGLLVFEFFAGYYITEVLRNIIHVTISGIYGTWYYLSKSDQGEPRWPATGAFKRAMTYSFGSICFGSLIVTFIDLLKQGLNILRSNVAAAGETCAQIGFLILDIIMGIIEWLARFFNQYSYSYIALYGDPYITAAKATWNLMKQKGVDALANECLIGTALGFYAMFNAYVTALFAYLYLKLTKPAYNDNGTYYAPVVAFCFVISLQISNIVTQPLKSGTSTFFIALARDPEIYQQSYPNRFAKIAECYPDVFNKLRG